MECFLKFIIFSILIYQLALVGEALVVMETSKNFTDETNIVVDFENSDKSIESKAQYVDNDVKIPPVTDTGPVDLVSDSGHSDKDQVDSELNDPQDKSAENHPLKHVADDARSVIDIGFNDALSQNSGLSDSLTDSAFPAVVSLVDTATQELRASLNDDPSAFPSNVTPPPATNASAPVVNIVNATADHEEYIVKAEPKVILPPVEVSDAKNETQETSETPQNEIQDSSETEMNIPILDVESNKPKPSETMPVFSEWAQKQLEEAEKNKEEVNVSAQNLAGKNKTIKGVNLKHTSKNYASPDCNAKIMSANPESSSMSSVLSPLRDEYALNTCTSKIWFVVELCESIQAKRIDLANFELFSSSPKDFSVYVSTRFPTRDWSNVGQFTAKDERTIQSFDLHPHLFGKYIKVEVQSHYGKEHFCPISLFRVYGTSEFEAFETENPLHPAQVDLDEDGDLEEPLSNDERNQTELNLFGSARDAVMHIMKKAAEVLTKGVDSNKNITVTNDTSSLIPTKSKICRTPSHIIVCDNCSDLLYSELYQILSCCNEQLDRLINNSLIRKLVHNTNVCLKYGLDFSNNANVTVHNDTLLFFVSAFEPKYVVAVCNAFAILEKKVVLNTSYEDIISNDSNLTIDSSDNNTPIVLEPDTLLPAMDYDKNKDAKLGDQIKMIEPTTEDTPSSDVKSTNSENSASTQINPTETSTADVRTEPTLNVEIGSKTQTFTEQNSHQDANNKDDNNTPSNTQAGQNEIVGSFVVKNWPEDQYETVTEDSLKISGQVPINENFENIFIDLDANDSLTMLGNSHTATAATPTATDVHNNQGSARESILIRLSNRVKALERNMSLSGQYLEELSRRYRNKVEELHLAFDSIKTTILEESKNRINQDQKKSEEIMALQQQVLFLTNEIRTLSEEKNSIQSRIWWILQFVLIIIVIVYVVMELFYKNNRQFDERRMKKKRNTIKRRKSVEGVSGHISPGLKKRRPSTEALNISGTYKDLLKQDSASRVDSLDEVLALRELNEGGWIISKGDKRRKRKKAQRSISNIGVPFSKARECETVIRRSSTFNLNVPVKSENAQSDIIIVGDQEFNGIVNNNVSDTRDVISLVNSCSVSSVETNRVLENGIHNTEKKSLRVSSPGFLRTALYKSKISKTPDKIMKSHNWEWYRRKKNASDNSSSLGNTPVSDVENMGENSINVNEVYNDSNSINSSISSSINSNNLIDRKDKNKTYFKKIFKRVF